MKIKDGWILNQVADTWVVLPLGGVTDLFGCLTLNDSGVLLWNALEKGADEAALVDVLTGEYDVSREEATRDVEEFLQTLKTADCLEF